MDHTKMSRQDIVQTNPIKQEKEAKLKVKEEKDQVNLKKKEEKKQVKDLEHAKNIDKPKIEQKSLFVRNISFDTTEEQFKEFMQKFGDVKYAVLCKIAEMSTN